MLLDEDDRFDRLRRIAWWDQERLRRAKILVLGAGALGNEILKNLALLGVGNLFIADMDRVENSNLSRSILFRERDSRRPKAQVAAEAVKDIYPEVNVHWFHGDVLYDLGLGVYDWADLVVAGVDSREARLHINRSCWKTKTPWVDGATEVLGGVVRVFVPPAAVCYECTMSAADWELLNQRKGCAGLMPADIQAGRVPTTPVTASIVAAIECQEAVKFLHGLETLAGHGLVFNGLSNDFYEVRYNAQQDCNSHEIFGGIVRLDKSVAHMTLREFLDIAETQVGKGAILELNHDILTGFYCLSCDTTEPLFRPRGAVPESAVGCPDCGEERRMESTQSFYGTEPFLARTLAAIGVPPYDIIVARKGFTRLAFEFSGDAPSVLGSLYSSSLLSGDAH